MSAKGLPWEIYSLSFSSLPQLRTRKYDAKVDTYLMRNSFTMPSVSHTLLALTLTASGALSLDPSSDCQTYHIFAARGSEESYATQRFNPFLEQICNGLGNTNNSSTECGYENIIYPANSSGSAVGAFCPSVSTGAVNGQAQIKAYAEDCPDAKLILVGYSQGGAVMEDVLGGGGGPIFDCTQPDSPSLDRSTVPGSSSESCAPPVFTCVVADTARAVVAAITFGAVRHTANQTYNYGTGAAYDGTRARNGTQLEDLQQYGGVLRSWCNYGDPICAVGSEPVDVNQHLNYFELYVEEASEWVVQTSMADVTGDSANATETTASTISTSTAESKADGHLLGRGLSVVGSLVVMASTMNVVL